MARKKLITTDELINLADLYCAENVGTVIKVTEFTAYVQRHGFPNVKEYTVRRNRDFMAYKDKINEEYKKRSLAMVPTYRSFDLDAVFSSGKSSEAIKETLKMRETYYCELVKSASNVFDQNKKLVSELDKKNNMINELKSQLNTQRNDDEEIRRLRKEILQCKNLIRKLKKVLDSDVYPEMANALLVRDGISESISELLSEEALNSIADADTEIPAPEMSEEKKEEKTKTDNKSAGDDLMGSMLSAFDD